MAPSLATARVAAGQGLRENVGKHAKALHAELVLDLARRAQDYIEKVTGNENRSQAQCESSTQSNGQHNPELREYRLIGRGPWLHYAEVGHARS